MFAYLDDVLLNVPEVLLSDVLNILEEDLLSVGLDFSAGKAQVWNPLGRARHKS